MSGPPTSTGNLSVSYSEAAAEASPGVAAAVERGLAETARALAPELVVVHVHDFAGVRPRSPTAIEVVVASSQEADEPIETAVARVSADAEIRGLREFADIRAEQPAPVDVAAVLFESSLDELAGAGPWHRELVDFVAIFSTVPPPNPSKIGATILVDGRTERLLYAASTGVGGRYLGP